MSKLTGLVDKDNVPVREGDIVRKKVFNGKEEREFFGEVVFDKGIEDNGYCLREVKIIEGHKYIVNDDLISFSEHKGNKLNKEKIYPFA